MSLLTSLYAADLPHRAVSVYMYLHDRANIHGQCFPGIPRIARELKISQSTVRRGIRDLKKAGFITTEQRYRNNGATSTLLFTLKNP